MDVAGTVAAILLGLAFLLAGGSKIAAGESWPVEAHGLGAPAWTIPIVPWIEIALGALLVTQLAPVVAAVAAAALLIVFTWLIARRLVAGEHPPCACFGAWSSSPIGWRHLARNGGLLVLAVVAAFA
jgi:uncharacterized membrane protein YphA (DoxX/SURF4 family)